MQHVTSIKPAGFRTITEAELSAIAGGDAPPAPIPGMDYDPITGMYEFEGETFSSPADHFGWMLLGGDADQAPGDGYNPGQDYCTLSPDSVYGVDISFACYTHDNNYSPDSTMDRSDADWEFAKDIYQILVSNGIGEGAAAEAAMIYHAGVHVFGWMFYEGQGNNN